MQLGSFGVFLLKFFCSTYDHMSDPDLSKFPAGLPSLALVDPQLPLTGLPCAPLGRVSPTAPETARDWPLGEGSPATVGSWWGAGHLCHQPQHLFLQCVFFSRQPTQRVPELIFYF